MGLDNNGLNGSSGVSSTHSTVTMDHAPTVTLNGLANGAHVTVGSTTTMNVDASDPDAISSAALAGLVRADVMSDMVLAKVDYYINASQVGEVTQGPFGFRFAPTSANIYVLQASATDGSNLKGVSDSITVEADAPEVSLTANNAGQTSGAGLLGTLVVSRTGDTSFPLTVNYKVKGNAVAGMDYKALKGNVTIPVKAAKAKIKIKAIDGSPNTGLRKIKVVLADAINGSYVVQGTGTAKIKLISHD